ncbi:MAG: DUF2693 domain-containing protein [Alistipes sp.]|nr:DUF2693 domain-containing protein [Alistipes sp.]
MNALVITNGTATRMAVIAARTGSELMAGTKAMMIQQLKEQLRTGVAHFIYIKKDGTIREAWGTTNATLAYKYTNGRGVSREIYSTTAYFDIEKSAWRSFRWESIVKVF